MTKTTNIHEFHPFYFALAFAISLLLFQVVLIYVPIESDTRTIISDLVSPLVSLMTMIGIFRAAIRTRKYSRSIARAWFFLGYAQLAYFTGDLLWTILEVGLKISPFPSIADVPYLIYYPLFFIAVMQFPSFKRPSFEWLKRFLDLIIIVIGGVMLYWNYILGPITQIQTSASLLTQVLAYAYPIGDLVLCWAILLLLFDRIQEKNGGPMLLVTLGVIVMVLTDSVFSIQSVNETYVSGGFLDIGWILQNLLVWLAAIWQLIIAEKFAKSESHSNTLISAINHLFSYYPFLWLLVGFAMMIRSHFVELPMSFLQIAGATMITTILVFYRQFIDNNQIRKLLTEVDTESKKNENLARELYVDTLHDFLTGLPNRALFMDRLDCAVISLQRRHDDPYTVLFLDLDDFKNINDSKGHDVGDDLLIGVSQRLRSCIRAGDTIARLGGDEFLILLETAGETQSVIITTNRILDALKKPFVIKEFNLFISVSIGVVHGIKAYENSTDILRDADIAMYNAKASGKSCFAIFDRAMLTQAINKVLIENELRYAIEYQQLRLLYQPIYSLATEQVIGFEALIRWKNARGENVMPDEFIPIAEETGLIIEIGDWVLQEACSQMKNWHNQFLLHSSLPVNVNISGLQLAQPDFKDKLKKMLKTTGLDPTALILEITESVLLGSQQKESDLFAKLMKLGVHLQIDDFGTGYSSLSYIQHIPVDALKIDRSFIKEVGNGEKNLELIRGIVSMARGMGMETTAEGVETKEQKEILTSLGCSYGQGYLWAKPMEPAAVERLLANLTSASDWSPL